MLHMLYDIIFPESSTFFYESCDLCVTAWSHHSNLTLVLKIEKLLDSKVTSLVMSSKFIKKQEFKLKKIKRLIYIRNKKRTEINMIKEQK